jgi:nucleotide-binding universal stress UspA family protein
MYRRILLAYDGSTEGRRALREGALLARRCQAEVHLLSVANASGGVLIGEGAFAGALEAQRLQVREIFDEGVRRLAAMGFSAKSRLVDGDPATEIRLYAEEIKADLVVVGHRRKSLLERWWSGSSGAWLSDQLSCSLLISRSDIADDLFEAELAQTQPAAKP